MDLECQFNGLSIVSSIFKGKGDIVKCSCFIAAQLFEHGMNVVEKDL